MMVLSAAVMSRGIMRVVGGDVGCSPPPSP